MILLDVLASNPKLEGFINSLIEQGSHLGWTIIKAIIVFVVGRFIIRMINKLVRRILTKRDFDPSVKTFVGSLVNVTLMILLIISVVGALGVQTTSFAALLASAGVAIGMALSGTLQNFAGGIMVMFMHPYRIGDYIEAQGQAGTVKEIRLFSTVVTTTDNKRIYIPNSSISNAIVNNYSSETMRRVEWKVSLAYGDDVAVAKRTMLAMLESDKRVLHTPGPCRNWPTARSSWWRGRGRSTAITGISFSI